MDGKIDVSACNLDDGTVVTVLVPGEGGVELTPEEEEELSAAMAEVEDGQWIDGDALLRELREMRAQSER